MDDKLSHIYTPPTPTQCLELKHEFFTGWSHLGRIIGMPQHHARKLNAINADSGKPGRRLSFSQEMLIRLYLVDPVFYEELLNWLEEDKNKTFHGFDSEP